MCGIAGIVNVQSAATVDEALLVKMNRAQTHRGPDAEGYHVDRGVGLAHRRLAIIDLSGGQQPLYNEDGSVVVVYNGEIYNYPELIDELTKCGHVFKTRCDTEVVVHAWEQWGERCVERFRGMFAFALWDQGKQTLFLARDRLGIKPLHYALLPGGWLAFGSELKSLYQHPALRKVVDPCAVEEYFAYGYVPEPRTILEGVYKLPPAHTLTVVRQGQLPEPRPYWDVNFKTNGCRDERDAAEQLVERIREAVRVRLIAEVPLGAFLSGGVDSSSVVAMMAGLSSSPVNTCSIAFDDKRYDEAAYANIVAEKFATSHNVSEVAVDDFDIMRQLAGVYDEPYADSSAIPTYRVCELARRQVTVSLSGDGGDELLAGYRRYYLSNMEDRLRGLLPLGLRRPLFGTLGSLYPKADWAPRVFRAKTTFEALAKDSVEGYFHAVSLLDSKLRGRLFSAGFKRQLQGYNALEVMRRHAATAQTDDPVSLLQYLDMKTYLVGDILTKVDRASMAHSLEVRVPLLDHHLVEWVCGLPSSWKLRGREGKYLLKKSMQPYLPGLCSAVGSMVSWTAQRPYPQGRVAVAPDGRRTVRSRHAYHVGG
jgi:asparagine synthase (glutamine-hydrolysing)